MRSNVSWAFELREMFRGKQNETRKHSNRIPIARLPIVYVSSEGVRG